MTGGAGADRFFNSGFEMLAGERDIITDFDNADRYMFQTTFSGALRYAAIAGGAAIIVSVESGSFTLEVMGASAAQLQAQTMFF